ncbi:MAG: 2-octaprenyl-6-methoxyphenyl hydroxylase [Gammaproteobacteria bacterium]|nr:MAG: 2-octaprenyl-6-methoxyphenyl hydroxylase [Gammaproteobacteria bacterium]RLA37997.1 MAG: 2-octaprenyl-6-methoxyphenyl hydroxylase [Gammaproteobacteria bacterium]
MGKQQKTDYDIIIAGGGMIGTSLGLALAPLKLKIAVVEAVARGAEQQPSFDDRSTALSRSSQRMFEAIGLWPKIVAASTPIKSIHVSDKGRFGFSHIDAAQQKVEALGYVVINRVLGQVLQDALTGVDGLDLICPGTITAVAIADDQVEVVVEEPGKTGSLSCKLLVAADGANSAVRDMIGISASRVDYEQWAVIGNLLPEKAPDNRAFERFTETGPVAMLPVADNRAGFVWMLSPDSAKNMLSLTDAEFTQQLQETFGYRLGRFSKVGKRAAYPLALTKANGLIARRSVIVGNAAHGLHPVAAQGFNLGMRDVAALCDCIADARIEQSESFDCGNPAILENYADWRRNDQGKVVRFTDGIVRLFGDTRPPVRALRNLGMLAFDMIPGVRKAFARHTMGLAGRLPRLSRGVPLK